MKGVQLVASVCDAAVSRIDRPVGGRYKRAQDIVLAFVFIVLLTPLFMLVYALVKFSSPGPVIFGHERIGFGGRSFKCLKFRTMVTNSAEVLAELLASSPEAAAEWAQTQKLRNDPRVTRIGHVLRVTSLDELPQLFNVLAGQMSLVGPRPIVSAELHRYGEHLPSYIATRPGLTGAWQVGGRNDTTYEERVLLDSRYARNWSALEDIKILFKTVGVVIRQKGSC